MKKVEIALEQELEYLDKILANIDLDIAVSMSYVRKVQGWTFPQLSKRFSNMEEIMWKRYMQPSYPSTRHIHVVAAYSWITMVPMTSFYKGLKIREAYRGMDNEAVEALICTGRIPNEQFNVVLNLIYNLLTDKGKTAVDELKAQLKLEYGDIDNYHEIDCFPPEQVDIKKFGEDYYRSIAFMMQEFRLEHGFSKEKVARVFGLSLYKYKRLEDPDIYQPFSMALGARLRLGFKVNSHVNFTEKMTIYPEFHHLRKLQHLRDLLIVESLKHLTHKQKKLITVILKKLADAYIDFLYI